MSRLRKRFLDTHGMTLQECQSFGEGLCEQQRDVTFQLGDLARYAEAKWPDTWQQVFPEWASPGLIARAAGVCRAYPKESDREAEATYSQYLQVASKPDRLKRLALIVDQGLTTDESRKADQEERAQNGAGKFRWLLAADVNYFLNEWWHSGAGVESAAGVSTWVQRTVGRLKEKGLTDCACCFDSHTNHRKELTKDWEDKYKGNRGPKDPELIRQLNLVYDLLKDAGFSCVVSEGMEADDVMASYAKQFDGKVTLLARDKDMRQSLSSKCNMLIDAEWTTDETSGDSLIEFKWVSSHDHTTKGMAYNSTHVEGIPPEKWTEFQTMAGDNTDNITGAVGIGAKIAADLVKQFGTVEAAIAAAKADDERIKPAKRKALIEFEAKLEVTRKLVTLRTDLELPQTTRI